MPTYQYQCEACGAEMEIFQQMTADKLTDCPQCGGSGCMKRLIGGGAGVIYNCQGFYHTDYRIKNELKQNLEKRSGQKIK